MRKRDYLAVVMMCALGSCVSVDYSNPTPGERTVLEKSYKVMQPSQAVVGGAVIRVKEYRVSTVARVKVLSDFDIDEMHFSTGQQLDYVGTIDYEGRKYNIARIHSVFDSDVRGLVFGDDGVVLNKMVNNLGINAQPVMMVYQFPVNPSGPHLQQVSEDGAPRPGGQNYEIIFTGITGDTIRMSYREYTPSDLARPAFAQDLTYPLKSTQIRFRNLLIGVNEVSGDHIGFAVLSDSEPN